MTVDAPPPPASVYATRVAALVAEFGEVPPPWAYFPRIHPAHIHWRMGQGEGYLELFRVWAASLHWSFDDGVGYVRRWDPPSSWLDWVIRFLWPEDFTDDVLEPSDEHFARLETLGLGSHAQWVRCFEVGPDRYPLAEDRSSGWLERDPATGEARRFRV